MKDIKINKLQRQRDHRRHEAHKNPTYENRGTYRKSRNKIKKAIKEKKTQFYRKVLSSKNSKEIWKVIHRILNPNMSTLQADPSALNEFFNKRLKDLSGKMQQRMALYYFTQIRLQVAMAVSNCKK